MFITGNRLSDVISDVSGDGESDIEIFRPSAGGSQSEIEWISDDKNKIQMPQDVTCFMQTLHRESEEQKNLEMTELKGNKQKKTSYMSFEPNDSYAGFQDSKGS